jgi:hypothetical protein
LLGTEAKLLDPRIILGPSDGGLKEGEAIEGGGVFENNGGEVGDKGAFKDGGAFEDETREYKEPGEGFENGEIV